MCTVAKQTAAPITADGHITAKNPGDLFVMDIWGPSATEAIMKERYFLSITDIATRYSYIAFLKEKSEVLDEIINYVCFMETQTWHWVKVLHTNNGQEFNNVCLHSFCKEKGMKLQFSMPYMPQQNSIAE